MDVPAEMGIDMERAQRRGPGRRVLFTVLAVVASMIALSSAIVYVVRGESPSVFDPIETARLAPADTHFFLALNTDLTSAPWLAVPRLLDALGVEDQLRDDLRESATDEGFDYDEEFVPVVRSIRRIGMAAQYTGADEGEAVAFIDTRDPAGLIALLKAGSGQGEWAGQRDDALGLDFEVFTSVDDGLESGALTIHEEVVYLGDDPEAIVSFLQRRAEQPSLADTDAFRGAVADVSEGALLVGYGSGGIFAHSDFQDFLDSLEDTSDVDVRDATLAFSFTAQSSGWGGRVAIALESGFGTLGTSVLQPTDLATTAALTPDDALVFTAGSGLGEGLRETVSSLRLQSPETYEQFVAPFEAMTGLSLEDDVLPLVGSNYGFALGLPDDGAPVTPGTMPWVLGLIESGDATALEEHIGVLIATFEEQCLCDSGIRSSSEGGHVTVRWPEAELSRGRLSDSTSFRKLRNLLPEAPSALLFFNARGAPEEVLTDWSGGVASDVSSDPDAYEVDWDALLGMGLALSGTDTSITIDFAVPIEVPDPE